MRDTLIAIRGLVEPDWASLASLAEELAAYLRWMAAVPAFVAGLLESWAWRVRGEELGSEVAPIDRHVGRPDNPCR